MLAEDTFRIKRDGRRNALQAWFRRSAVHSMWTPSSCSDNSQKGFAQRPEPACGGSVGRDPDAVLRGRISTAPPAPPRLIERLPNSFRYRVTSSLGRCSSTPLQCSCARPCRRTFRLSVRRCPAQARIRQITNKVIMDNQASSSLKLETLVKCLTQLG